MTEDQTTTDTAAEARCDDTCGCDVCADARADLAHDIQQEFEREIRIDQRCECESSVLADTVRVAAAREHRLRQYSTRRHQQILSAKDAEIERLRDELVETSCAAEYYGAQAKRRREELAGLKARAVGSHTILSRSVGPGPVSAECSCRVEIEAASGRELDTLVREHLSPAPAVDGGGEDQTEPYRELLADIWLYVNWFSVTKQLTTEQKELWADAVEWSSERDHPGDGTKADRWWRDAVPARPATTPIDEFFTEFPEVANARVRFWACPDEQHRDKGIVQWRGDVAHCMEDGCGRNSAESRPAPTGEPGETRGWNKGDDVTVDGSHQVGTVVGPSGKTSGRVLVAWPDRERWERAEDLRPAPSPQENSEASDG